MYLFHHNSNFCDFLHDLCYTFISVFLCYSLILLLTKGFTIFKRFSSRSSGQKEQENNWYKGLYGSLVLEGLYLYFHYLLVPDGYIPRLESKEMECWKFLDWRLNSENDSRLHGQPSWTINSCEMLTVELTSPFLPSRPISQSSRCNGMKWKWQMRGIERWERD